MHRSKDWKMLAQAGLYPLVSLFLNAVALGRTLWNSRVLLEGQWQRYLNYRPVYAVTMLFYWTQAIQLKRHGRHGVSPTLGNGCFPMTRWWHLTLASNYAFHALGIAGVVGAMGFWWLSHLLWIESGPPLLVAAAMLLAALSSIFFAQAFVTQNYNAFGWMFMPAALWGLLTSHPVVAALAWFGASFGSITTIFIGCALSAALAAETASLLPLVAIAPAAIKVLVQVFAIQAKARENSILPLLKAVGVTGRGVRYRLPKARWLSGGFLYLCALLAVYTAATWWFAAPGRAMIAAMLLLFIVNQRIARFADPQSFQIAWLSVATATCVASANPWLLLPCWLLINPFPFMTDATTVERGPLRLPALAPFDVAAVTDPVAAFFAPVAPGQRVLFIFPDPGTEHDRVFSGYRTIMEAAFHVGTVRAFHVVPDWYFVYQYNYPEAPDCWASGPDAAAVQARRWEADFIVVVETEGGERETDYAERGFAPTGSRLDWSELTGPSLESLWGTAPSPRWSLLRAGHGA